MNCLIGIDGGGSRTRAVLVDSSGNLLAGALGGPANIQFLDKETLKITINSLLSELYASSRSSPRTVKALVAGFAGAGRPSDRKIVGSIFDELDLKDRYKIVTDMEIALYGAFRDEPGIILIAGTGSAAFGRDAAGILQRCGGWGYLVGDEGSGYYIGRTAVRYALQSYDTILPATVLVDIICKTFDLEAIDQIIPKIYSCAVSRIDIANLAPAVLDAAAQGDAVAMMIIEDAGKSLGKLVETLLHRLNLEAKPVNMCLTGSIFNKREILLPHIMKNLREDVRLVDPQFPPVAGAVLLAFKQANITIDAEVEANLRKIRE